MTSNSCRARWALALAKALLPRPAALAVGRAAVALGQIHHLFKSME